MMVVVLLSTVVAVSRTSLPLCDVSKGFAGEMNNKFTLLPNVEVNSQKNEALVIAVAPVVAMGPVQATINATFTLNDVVISLMSDREGVLVIQDSIPMGTEVQIDVDNLRSDGSTPFTIYSYIANKPTCFIGVERGRSFNGPVPTLINGAPASVYFVSQPTASTSFKFNVDGGVGSSVTFADSVSKIGSNSVSSLRGTDPQVWSTRGPVYFVVQPVVPSQPVWHMRASISWSQPDVADVPKETESDAPNPDPKADPAPKKESSMFATVLGLTILGMVCYFAGRSVYNYRVLEIHEFPECVPHHVEIAGAAAHAKDFFVSSKESFNTRRSAYSGVNGDDEDVA